MFKDEPLWQVILFAATAAMMFVLVVTVAMRSYELETRPWGNECKQGDFKPGTDKEFPASCYRGYWEYLPPMP
jgi:hypothetical protein